MTCALAVALSLPVSLTPVERVSVTVGAAEATLVGSAAAVVLTMPAVTAGSMFVAG